MFFYTLLELLRYMVECVGTGLGLVDVDDDGDLDLYLVQGGELDAQGRVTGGATSRDALYLNDGHGHFEPAPEASEVSDGFMGAPHRVGQIIPAWAA